MPKLSKMARLTPKLCLAAACLMLVCTAVASAADSAELTDEQLDAQIAKLQKQKALRASGRERRADVSQPQMVTMDGNLTFKVKDGKRIG